MPQESNTISVENKEREQVEHLPEKQEYSGTDFVVAVIDEKKALFSTDEVGESIIKSAVEQRNKLVTDKYGIVLEIKYVRANDVLTKMKAAQAAGTQYADLLCFPGDTLVSLADNNLLFNLISSEDFKITAKYIDTNNAKSVAVNNSLYMLYESATQYYDDAWVVFYDKGLISEANLTDPAALVANGQWTWGKFAEYAETVSYKVMNKGSPDLKTDIFGYSSYNNDTELPLIMWESCGTPMFGNTYLKKVSLDVSLTKLNDSVAFFKEIYTSKSRYPLDKSNALDAFSDGRLAFLMYKLEYAAALESSDREWGLLPLPKYNEEQKSYYSFVDAKAYALAIPSNVSDPQKSVILLNAFCAASGEAVKEAVKTKYVNLFFQNNTSTVMLGTIIDTVYLDMAALYGSKMEKVSQISIDIVVNAITKNAPINKTITDLTPGFDKFSEEKFT